MSGPRLVHALVVHTDGRLSERQVRDDLSTLQQLVGGAVEYLPLRPGSGLFANESGVLDGLPHNTVATAAALLLRPELAPMLGVYGLRGDCVFLGITTSGASRDCPQGIAEAVRTAAKSARAGGAS